MGVDAIKLEGFEEFLNAVKELPENIKKPHIAGLMKKNLKIVERAIYSQTPVRRGEVKAIKRYRKGGELAQEYLPGNLRRSIGMKAFTKGENVAVYAGINKKNKADGWYGFFLERGTKHISPRRFISLAASVTVPIAEENLTKDVRDYIAKNAKKLGLDAK